MTTELKAALKADAAARVPGAVGALYPLDSLTPRAWDYGLPTIVRERTIDNAYQHRSLPTQKEFNERFFREAPPLAHVDWSHLFAAGGLIAAFAAGRGLCGEEDIDLFVHGVADDREANKVVESAVSVICDHFDRKYVEVAVNNLAGHLDEMRLRSVERKGRATDSAAATHSNKVEALRSPEVVAQCRLEQVSAVGAGQYVLRIPCEYEEFFGNHPVWPHRSGKKYTKSTHASVTRTGGAITLVIDPAIFRVDACYGGPSRDDTTTLYLGDSVIRKKVQFILRRYGSPSEVLHGFDLAASSVGFDGKTTYTTHAGTFAVERMVIPVDTSRRSTTFEQRLVKYYKRGYSLVLLEFDIATLAGSLNLRRGVEHLIDLPYFPFAVKRARGNQLLDPRFLFKTGGSGSDYDTGATGEKDYVRANIRRLLDGETDDLVRYTRGPLSAEMVLRIMSARPHIDHQMIREYFNDLEDNAYKHGTLHLNTVKRYTKLPAHELTAAIAARLEDSPKMSGARPHVRIAGEEEVDPVKAVVSAAIQKQADVCAAALDVYDATQGPTAPPTWKEADPGTQLTGSINPIIEEPEEWYGAYHLKPEQ